MKGTVRPRNEATPRARSAAAGGLALVAHDLRMQWRSGFYAAYLFVAVVYVALLRLLPADIAARALPPLLFTEAGVIGFLFAGTLLHLERREGALRALGVTPLHPAALLLARTLAFALLIVAVGAAVAMLSATAAPVRPAALVLVLLATALLFVPLGLACAAAIRTLDRFIIGGGLLSALLALPLAPYLGAPDSPLWSVTPSYGLLRGLGAAVGQWPAPQATHGALLTLVTAAWIVAAALAATRLLGRRVLGRGEGAS
jgi:fluoroquinolone transport system permease protein